LWLCLIIAKKDLQLTDNFSKQEVHVADTTLKKGTRVTGVDRKVLRLRPPDSHRDRSEVARARWRNPQ
jgi:hypothetical protein